MAKELATEMYRDGYHKKAHKDRISALNKEQRQGALQALYEKMFNRKQRIVDVEGFKLKHGRGEEINHDLVDEDDIELDAYAAASKKKAFNTEK